MKVWITGISGELGSNLAKLLSEMGFKVYGNDIVRIKEAWRLSEVIDQIEYTWKSTQDLDVNELKGMDFIIDAGCFADRPFGEKSPDFVFYNNITTIKRVLDIAKKLDKKPVTVYPSSFVIFFGVPPSEQPITENTVPRPQGMYALTKFFAEEICKMYYYTYKVPVIVTRVGSCFGEGGRSDQFIHRIIIEMLKGKDEIKVWSPKAGRAYTYANDALEFYRILFDKFTPELIGMILHNAGNKENKPYRNYEIAEIVKKITGYDKDICYIEEYEVTELVYDPKEGKKVPVIQHTDWKNSLTYKLLGWKPKYTITEGLKKTAKWFEENLEKYI